LIASKLFERTARAKSRRESRLNNALTAEASIDKIPISAETRNAKNGKKRPKLHTLHRICKLFDFQKNFRTRASQPCNRVAKVRISL
jgi:hypothetical protein